MSGVAGVKDTWLPHSYRLYVSRWRVLLKQMLSHLFHPADYLSVWPTRHVTHILNINAQQRNPDQHRDVIGEGKQTFRRRATTGHIGGQNKAIKDVEDVGPHDCRGPGRRCIYRTDLQGVI